MEMKVSGVVLARADQVQRHSIVHTYPQTTTQPKVALHLFHRPSPKRPPQLLRIPVQQSGTVAAEIYTGVPALLRHIASCVVTPDVT